MSKLKDSGVLLREDFDAGPSNLDEIEPGLWLGEYAEIFSLSSFIVVFSILHSDLFVYHLSGNLTAATDKDTLQTRGISHILTVDSCSLPNNITEKPGMVTKFIKGL